MGCVGTDHELTRDVKPPWIIVEAKRYLIVIVPSK